MCPDALADNIVTLNVRDLEAWFNGCRHPPGLGQGVAPTVTGSVDATVLETTAQGEGVGHVTRTRKMTDTRGDVHASEVTIDGWKLIVLIEAGTKIPLAVKVGTIHEHEALWTRALGTQARLNLVGATRLHKVLFEKGFLDGSTLWWLDQQGLTVVVPAKTNMAVPADARAQAATEEGSTVGRRVHTVRHGQGRGSWTERLETEVVGMTGLTTYDQ
jgi:hypothetical protein